jgi:RNA polymerase sigma-70 factor (ECF subfamily)
MTLLKKNKNNREHLDSSHLPSALSDEPRAFVDESLKQLYAAIRQLSEVDRAVILLYLEEKSYQELADVIGSNPNNVGVRIKRIKERLKKLLDGKVN